MGNSVLLKVILAIVETTIGGVLSYVITDKKSQKIRRIMKIIILAIIFLVLLTWFIFVMIGWPTSRIISLISNDPTQNYETGCYYEKLGVKNEKNYEEAYKWFTDAAKEGNYDAYAELGDLIYFNEVKNQGTLEDAFSYYKLASEKGIVKGKIGVARYYFLGVLSSYSDLKSAFELLNEISPNNDCEANLYLGECYYIHYSSCGIDKDIYKAISCFAIASNKYGDACYYLSEMIKNNEYKADDQTYIYYVSKGAELGNARAEEEYAYCFWCGLHGIKQNIQSAYDWYKKAINQGKTKDGIYIANFVIENQIVDKDLSKEQAFRILVSDAEYGNDPCSAIYLANFYFNGLYIDIDYDKAYYYAVKAISENASDASVYQILSDIFKNGYGSTQQSLSYSAYLARIHSTIMSQYTADNMDPNIIVLPMYPNKFVDKYFVVVGFFDGIIDQYDCKVYDSQNSMISENKSEGPDKYIYEYISMAISTPKNKGNYKVTLELNNGYFEYSFSVD